MSLSKEQIVEIGDFIHSRGFKHIEVEMEILDHVASAIEEKFVDKPELTLNKAIQEVHSSFGPLGFSVFEDELIKKTERKTLTYAWQTLLSLFTSKRLLLLMAVFAVGLLIGAEFLSYFTPVIYHWFFYLVGLISSLVGILLLLPLTRTWFKRSIVMGNVSNIHMVSYLILGQSFGIHLKHMAENGSAISPILFAMYFTLTILVGVISHDTIKRAFDWTYSTYLKYAD